MDKETHPTLEEGDKVPKAVSRAQARFFGAVAGGSIKAPGLSREEAKKRLRGLATASLPERTGEGSKEETRQERIEALRRARSKRRKS